MIGSVLEQTRHYNRFVTQGGQGYDPKWKGVMDDYGFNCGVLMMNLTRLRDFKWLKKPEALAKKAVKKGKREADGLPPTPRTQRTTALAPRLCAGPAHARGRPQSCAMGHNGAGT